MLEVGLDQSGMESPKKKLKEKPKEEKEEYPGLTANDRRTGQRRKNEQRMITGVGLTS